MAVNVRVVSRASSSASVAEKDRDFKKMFSIFRKAVMDNGCLQLWREKQTFESKGDKVRRKKKESVLVRRKERNHD